MPNSLPRVLILGKQYKKVDFNTMLSLRKTLEIERVKETEPVVE